MKLQKSTLILLTTALLLGSFVYISEVKNTEKQDIVDNTNQQIFNFKEEEIESLEIEREDEVLELIQTDNDLFSWEMTKPDKFKVNDGAISYLITPLISGKIEKSFTITEEEKSDYGLDKDITNLTINLKNEETHKLILGKKNFDEQFVYGFIDSISNDNSELTVNLLPIALKYGTQRPLNEWKQKDDNSDEEESLNDDNDSDEINSDEEESLDDDNDSDVTNSDEEESLNENNDSDVTNSDEEESLNENNDSDEEKSLDNDNDVNLDKQ